MILACGTVTFRKYPLLDALKRIQAAGYEYVEPQATPPFCPHVDVDQDDPEQFKRLIADMGFKGATALWATHGALIPDPLSSEYGVKCVEWAAAAGIPGINLGDGFKPQNMSDDDALKLVQDRLGPILEAAEKTKTYVGIEPHGTFSLTAEGLLKLLSLSDSPWLGVNYDMANVYRAGYVESLGDHAIWRSGESSDDEVAVLRAVMERVVHVHVKDLKGQECVALGQGEVNVTGCLDALVEAGYDGPISLETEGDFDGEVGDQIAVESLHYLLETLDLPR